MSTIDATGVLRAGLLEDVTLLVAGVSAATPRQTLGATVVEACIALGGKTRVCEPDATDEAAIDTVVEAAIAELGRIDALVVDAAALFAMGSDEGGGHASLRNCLDSTWNVTRAVINHAFLPDAQGGRIVYLAPAPATVGLPATGQVAVTGGLSAPGEAAVTGGLSAPGEVAVTGDVAATGELAETARAGLENLARTLSVEWARHAVNVVCIAPGANTAAGEVATLCAYLASPAGAYFSGCLLDLRGV